MFEVKFSDGPLLQCLVNISNKYGIRLIWVWVIYSSSQSSIPRFIFSLRKWYGSVYFCSCFSAKNFIFTLSSQNTVSLLFYLQNTVEFIFLLQSFDHQTFSLQKPFSYFFKFFGQKCFINVFNIRRFFDDVISAEVDVSEAHN